MTLQQYEHTNQNFLLMFCVNLSIVFIILNHISRLRYSTELTEVSMFCSCLCRGSLITCYVTLARLLWSARSSFLFSFPHCMKRGERTISTSQVLARSSSALHILVGMRERSHCSYLFLALSFSALSLSLNFSFSSFSLLCISLWWTVHNALQSRLV